MIQKSDLRQITYQEFGDILSNLEKQVVGFCNESGIKFDLIVPILRSGAFTGFHLASKLQISNILPAQYKYEYLPKEKVVKKFELPQLLFDLPDEPKILITDSNTVWGGIAKKVIEDIRNKFPKGKLYFASANLDLSTRELEGVEKIFYGTLSNEKGELSVEEAEEKGITNDVFIFPWEDLEEQWSEINASQTQSSGE